MNKMMRKLANTIVANLGNTSEIGLFKGKMGIALFMYEYAKRLPNGTVYEEVADLFIDDIYNQVKPDTPPNIMEGSAGIGLGLCYLLKNHLIDGDPDSVLGEIDKRLLENPEDVLLKEISSANPVFSSGAYLLSRLPLCSEEQKDKWVTNCIDTGISFMWKIIMRRKFEPQLSLLNSMFLVYYQLMQYSMDKENVLQLQKDLLRLSVNAIEKKYYQHFDVILLKYILSLVPKDICNERSRLESLLSDINTDDFSMEEWNNNLWWYFVYGITPLEYPIEIIEKYVDQKLLDYSYDIEIINTQFAVLGLLLLMKQPIIESKCPHIIHQIWSGVDEPLPKKLEILGQTWKRDYPDWQYEIWDNERMNTFVKEKYPQYWDNYCKFPYNIQRWDAIRYLILKEMGGMYVDFDYESIRPLDELIQNKTCCFSMENDFHCEVPFSNCAFTFNNALILSTPNHSFINKLVEKVFSDDNVEKRYEDKKRTVFKTTGPFIINQLYEGLTKQEKAQIYLIPARFVSPLNCHQTKMIRDETEDYTLKKHLADAYAIHYYIGSWVSE